MDQRRTNYRTTKLYHAKWNLIFESDIVSNYFLGILGPYLDIELACASPNPYYSASIQCKLSICSYHVYGDKGRTSTFLAVP